MSIDKFRNQPCPCRSGKKYKHCHQPMDNATKAETETPLGKRKREKTSRYWAKRYKEVTDGN